MILLHAFLWVSGSAPSRTRSPKAPMMPVGDKNLRCCIDSTYGCLLGNRAIPSSRTDTRNEETSCQNDTPLWRLGDCLSCEECLAGGSVLENRHLPALIA